MIIEFELKMPEGHSNLTYPNSAFLVFPDSNKSDWPDSDANEGAWLFDPVVNDGELIKFAVKKAKDKVYVHGGGTFPVMWRRHGKPRGPLSLDRTYELPLSLWEKMKIVEQVPNGFMDVCKVRIVSTDI